MIFAEGLDLEYAGEKRGQWKFQNFWLEQPTDKLDIEEGSVED